MMKKYPYVITGACAFLGFGLALFVDGANVTALIPAQNAFVSSKDSVQGTFSTNTFPDLLVPMPPACRFGVLGPAPHPHAVTRPTSAARPWPDCEVQKNGHARRRCGKRCSQSGGLGSHALSIRYCRR